MSSDNTSKFSRRQVLQATAGVSSLTVLPATTAASSEDTVTIVTHKRGDEPLIKKEVPKRWKARFEAAQRAKAAMVKQYMDASGVKTIALTSVEERVAGKRAFAVKVEVEPEAETPSLPDVVGETPVVTTEYKKRRPMYCHGNSDYDSLPGGVILDEATSGSPYYYDYDGDGSLEIMHLTAGHIFGDNCNNLENTAVDQKSDIWGTVKIHSSDNDYALCTPNAGYYVSDQIQEPGNSAEVTGYVTKNGLGDLASNNTTVYKVGISTAKQDGTVEDIGIYASDPSCADYDGEGVGLSVPVYPGDSGGPIYHDTSYGVTMIAITSAGYNTSSLVNCEFNNMLSRTEGPSAYHIKNFQGGRFTNPNP